MLIEKGDQRLVRRQNRSLVMNLLRWVGPMSRTDIAERAGLAPSALTRLARDLMAEGVVFEVGKTDSSGGRPAVLLSLHSDYARSIGIRVERDRLVAASVDLVGAIRDRAEWRLSDPSSPAEMIDGIVALANRFSAGRILGIGVSISGPVGSVPGTEHPASILGWERVSLRKLLTERLGLPVWIENDANALALAELWYGAGRGFKHFICITVGERIGAGIVINGAVYRGAYGGAGALGHTTIDPEGPVCRCQQRGCLEVYASDRFLFQEATHLGYSGIPELIAAAQDGEAQAREVFSKMGRSLGLGVKNLVDLLNPEAIILGGTRMDAAAFFVSAVEDVCGYAFPSEGDRLHILPAGLGRDGLLIGSATFAAADFFHIPTMGGPT